MSVAALRASAVLALVVALLFGAGCSRAPRKEQFVGVWKSSRMATGPLHMHANGDWELRTPDGQVLQYGVWQLDGQRIVWSIRIQGRLEHDPNRIVSVADRHFELAERDGSITTFDRID